MVKNDHAISARKKLKDDGLSAAWAIVLADDFHLQVDIDGVPISENGLPKQFQSMFAILQEIHTSVIESISSSKSGKGQHVIIKTEKALLATQLVRVAAGLGSDPKREALALRSIARRELNPILLFERKCV